MRPLAAAMLALVVSACGGATAVSPSPPRITQPPPSATPAPTPALTAEPTDTPTLRATEHPTADPTRAASATPLLTQAPVACGPVEFPSDLGNAHLDRGVDFTGAYSSRPPTSGPHDPVATTPGAIYEQPQRPEELVHAMEHGAVIFWAKGLTPQQEGLAKSAVAAIYELGYESVIWTPYQDMDAPFAMTAWGVLQECTDVDPVAMQAFVASYFGSGGEGFFACNGAAAELPPCTEQTP